MKILVWHVCVYILLGPISLVKVARIFFCRLLEQTIQIGFGVFLWNRRPMQLISYLHAGFGKSNPCTSLMDFDSKFRNMRFYTSKEQLRKVDMRNNCV